MKILIAFALVAAAAAVAVPKPVQLAEAPEPEVFEAPAVIADASQKDLESIPDPVYVADAPIDTVIVEHVQFVDHAEGFGNDFVHPFAYAGFDDAAEPSNIENDAFVHPLAYGEFEDLGAEPNNFDDSYVHPFAYGAFDEVAQNAADAANEEFAEEDADKAAPTPIKVAAIQDIPSETDDDEVAPSAVNFVELVEDSENEIPPSAINFVEMPAPLSLGEIPAPENFDEPETA